MMIARRRLLAALAAFGLPGGPTLAARPGAPRALNDMDLLRFVELMALTRQGRNGIRRPAWARRWTQGIEVDLAGGDWTPHLDALDRILRTVTEWTGLPVTRALLAGRRHGHLTIRLLAHDDVVTQNGAGGAVCTTWTFGNGGDLHTAHMDVSDAFLDCIEHEFMHVLGIDNHWNGAIATPAIPSVLAPRGRPGRTVGFSDWDEMTIRLLYHPGVRPGMGRQAALSVMRRLLATNALPRPTGRAT